MCLPRAWRSKEQGNAIAPQEGVLRERLDLSPWHAGIELPVECFERGDLRKPGEADAALESALPARIDFTL